MAMGEGIREPEAVLRIVAIVAIRPALSAGILRAGGNRQLFTFTPRRMA